MKKRILLADDDPSVLELTKVRLEHVGFDVVTATDGQAAVEKAVDGTGIDLILMDLRMPKLSGLEVCQQLKQNPSAMKIPVILFSASSTSSHIFADRCVELGIADWIRKPFQSKDLLEKIHRVLGP